MLAETEKALEEFHGRPADVLENDPLLRQKRNEAVQALDRALGVAIRRGVLAKNVLSHPRLLALATFGDRGALRRIDKNLESGVKRPLAMRDVVLEARLLEMHAKGFSLEQMRDKLQKPDKPWEKRLLAMDFFKNSTRTGVRSWLCTKVSKTAIHTKLKALKPPAAARKTSSCGVVHP